MKLPPRVQRTLFVPPCRKSFADCEQFQLYYCPEDRDEESARYVGIYAQKTVRAIGRVVKIVACNVNLKSGAVVPLSGQTSNLNPAEEMRIAGAARNGPSHGWDLSTGHRFYLCDEMEATDFRKTSAYGIRGPRYFDLEEVLGTRVPPNLRDLANKLRLCTWK